ncbi:hypothetical protein O3M35_012270 [Rhynocoris fuscipes]|uniref:Uncharacterized protein n=1 Tax=Rhynocoris fuscipes TaxID=488301 RepID=A0AAW1CY91_9HEMI
MATHISQDWNSDLDLEGTSVHLKHYSINYQLEWIYLEALDIYSHWMVKENIFSKNLKMDSIM